MDISVFVERLQSEIIKFGITKEPTERYIQNLKKSLTPDDISGISDYDIIKYAKVCAEQITKHDPSAMGSTDKNTAKQVPPASVPDDNEVILLEPDDIEDDSSASSVKNESSVPAENKTVSASDEGFDETSETTEIIENTTHRGNAMLILITAVSSPLWLIATALFLAPFIIMFAAETALTAVFVCALAGFTALGTAASLTGIVYGIVKMFSIPAIGLYEIGFGVIIAGVAMICGIIIYNGAVRFMPWVFRKTGQLVKFTFSKVKPFLAEYKRRCRGL